VDNIAGEMQNYLNKFYDIFADKILNVQQHRLQIKKEYVARAGFWVAKKRYAQWIISNNGVPVDKLDVKGLDVIRSSFPKAFQDLMSKVLIEILKDTPQSTISDIILGFKSSMIQLSNTDIAKNSAVKELSKYMNVGSTKLFDFKKGAPAHVKAGIAYNDLLKYYKTPYKYAPMKNGDKIKWVYLKRNPFGLDAVGFTGYKDPPEITKFIDTYINHEKIFERELLGKLQDFYDVLKWGLVLNEQKTASKFFNF